MAKVVWTDYSLFELKEIFDYISKDSKRYAENQIRRIKLKASSLKDNPYFTYGSLINRILLKILVC